MVWYHPPSLGAQFERERVGHPPTCQDYKVSFGKIARTIVYEDDVGSLLFVFDASVNRDQSTGKWTLYLDCQPLVDGRIVEPKSEEDRRRVASAVKRAKRYAESRGYLVETS